MISTARLFLRPWQESDLGFLQGLRNDSDLQALLLANARGSNVSSVRSWLEAKSSGANRLFFVVELNQTKESVGYIQVSEEAEAEKTVRFGICLANQYWSQGYGTEIIEAIEAHLRSHCGIHKVILHVDETNTRAVACYSRLGYREVGVMRRHVLVQGRLRNVVIMEKLIYCDLGNVD
jgi:RimJ/RimL family protein N-acetyltransferase